MQRKIIQQSATSVGISLPKKWVDSNNLSAGDVLEVKEEKGKLSLSSGKISKIKKEINLNINKGRENFLRMMIVNAYRTGYNQINLNINPSMKDDLKYIVEQLLMGFELFKISDEKYVIESVAEPSYENFDKIVMKLFFILQELLDNIEGDSVKEYAKKIQRSDNFLKRSLSKNNFHSDITHLYWQLFSNLVHISRQIYHFNRTKKVDLSDNEIKIQEKLKEMLNVLRNVYSKKDISKIGEIDKLEHEINFELCPKMIYEEDAYNIHYLANIGRAIYISSSPLMGIIEMDLIIN